MSNKSLRMKKNNKIIYNIFNLNRKLYYDFVDIKYNTIKFIQSLFKYNQSCSIFFFYIKQYIFPLEDNDSII